MSELITMDKRDLIKAFRDYQKEWLYSHHEFELSPMLEEVIAKFLDDTAERFMVEKAQLSEEDATKDATSGLISRKDAIDEVEDTDWYHQNKKGEMVHGANPADHQAWYKAEDIYKVLESLPSAEPEIIRCKDCRRYNGRPCGLVDWYNTANDFCSRAERRNDG